MMKRANAVLSHVLGDVSHLEFHPVIDLPAHYEVFDFTQGPYDPNRHAVYGVGKHNEARLGMYVSSLFAGNRNIHAGIDISAPVGSPVYAFYPGQVHAFGYLAAEGDYGFSVVTRHEINGKQVFALYGHLSASSVQGKRKGVKIERGQIIGSLGHRGENGGWNPHVHFQLCVGREPSGFDMPGTVTAAQRDLLDSMYIDPRVVLGRLYDE
jgi:murein DD-endopeptidase MepM/ murein hydrolase activator NlpD